MKKNGALKLTILIVSVLLIALISFVGIYKNKGSNMENILPDYLLGKELNGTRLITFVVDEEENEDETETEKEEATEESEEETKNEESILTESNYQLAKSIMKKRLSKLGISSYDIRLNKNDGTIALELPENALIDDILVYLYSQGKFEILDSETEEVLLDSSKIKETKTVYYNGKDGINVYLDIVFDEAGKTKLEEISKTYVETTDEEGNKIQKTVTIKLDDETVTKTYFGQTMSTGELPLTIGSATKDTSVIEQYRQQSNQIAILLNNGVIPISYEVDTNEYISPVINEKVVNAIIILGVAVLVLLGAYLVFKYKTDGIISIVAMIGYLAIYLLLIRLTDAKLSFEAFSAIGICTILEFVFLIKVLAKIYNDKKANADVVTKKELIKSIQIQIPLYIMSVIFVIVKQFGVTNWEDITNFGITMFWGLVVSVLYNFTITRMLFIEKENIK